MVFNPNFDGDEDLEVLDSAQSSLSAGDTAQIRMTMDIGLVTDTQSLGLGNYSNQVTLAGTSTSGVSTSDTSDFGTDPDPNGNGNANESGENDATTFTLSSTGRGGLALSASTTGTLVSYTYHLANLGSNVLSSVTLQNDLDAVFGEGNYSLTSGPTLISVSGLVLNPSFNGSSDTNLLLASSTLSNSETAQVTLTVEVTESNQGNGFGIYDNQALLIATETTGLSFSDLSDSGTDPDASNNGDPGESGEDDPTLITVDGEPAIGVAKQATIVGGLIYLDFAIENLGNATLSSLSLTDDLDAVFGAGNYSISTQPSAVSGPGTLTLSGSYTWHHGRNDGYHRRDLSPRAHLGHPRGGSSHQHNRPRPRRRYLPQLSDRECPLPRR